MKYNIILLIAAFFTVIHALDWKPKTREEWVVIIKNCVKKNPVSAEVIEYITGEELPDDEALRNCVLCVVKKAGLFSENQGYLTKRVAAQLNWNMEQLGLANGCFNVDESEEETSAQEKAFSGVQCLMQFFGEKW